MAKIQNISGDDLLVPGLGHRLVVSGAVVEVPDDEADSYTCQTGTWAVPTKAKAITTTTPQEG